MADVETVMHSLVAGLVVSVVVEEVEVVQGGGGVEIEVEKVVTGVSRETAALIVSLELRRAIVAVVVVTNESDVTEPVDVTDGGSSLASVTELIDGISDVLLEGEGAVVVTEIAASPPAAGSTFLFGSGKVDFADRFVDVVVTELSLLGAETVSVVAMEGVVIVAEVAVTERLGVIDSEEVEVTETEVGSSVGVVVVAWKVEVGSLVGEEPVSGTEALLSSAVSSAGVIAAGAGITESVHTSVSEGVTVLERGTGMMLAESAAEFEIVGLIGLVVAAGAAGADGAAAGLSLVGVFASASCIWANSFSGVLRPDVVGGGPGLITGFGSRAGFPAASCAETLARI